MKSLKLVFLLLALHIAVIGQSGRQRPAGQTPKGQAPRKQESVTPPPVDAKTNSTAATPIKVAAGAAVVKQEVVGATSRYVFKNGLTLIVREQHSTSLAAAAVYVRAGLVDGQQASIVAALLSNFPKGVLAEISSKGGISQSATSYGHTVYTLVGPSSNFQNLLEMYLKVFANRVFTPDEVTAAEALVVAGSPFEQAKLRTVKQAFARTQSDNLDLKAIQNFYETYYTADQIIIVVTGDVGPERVRLVVQRCLGTLKPGGKKAELQPTSPEVRYIDERRSDVTKTAVTVAYPVDLPRPVAEALVIWLTKGQSAFLRDFSPSLEYVSTSLGGLLLFQLQTSPQELARTEGNFFDRIEDVRRTLVSTAELQRIRSLGELAHTKASADILELAFKLAEAEAETSYKDFDDYVKQLQAVTAEQLQQVAAKYLAFSSALVHELQPQSAPARLAGSDPIYTPERFQALIAVLAARTARSEIEKNELVLAPNMAVVAQGTPRNTSTKEGIFTISLLPQPVRDFSTLNGPRAYVREDQSKPLLSVGIYFLGGRALESEADAGVTQLMLRMLLRGSKRFSAAAVASFLDQLGAEIEIVNEADFCGLVLTVLSRNAEEALKLLVELIENPLLPEEDLELVKAELKARLDLVGKIACDAVPYRRSPLSLTAGAVAKLTQKDVVECYRRVVKSQLPVVILVGDTDGSALVGRVIARGFQRRESSLKLPALVGTPSERQIVVDGPSSSVTLCFVGSDCRKSEVLDVAALLLRAAFPTAEINKRFFQASLSVSLDVLTGKEQDAVREVVERLKQIANLSEEGLRAASTAQETARVYASTDHAKRATMYARAVFCGLAASEVDTTERYKSVAMAELIKYLTNPTVVVSVGEK